MRLKNKTCVVTGAGAGIGFETANTFAVEGAQVIAMDLNLSGLEKLSEKCPTVQSYVLDVTDADAVEAFFKSPQTVDVLFNCAGMVATGNILTCTKSDWARSLDLNVSALFYMCRYVLPLMLSGDGGSIINMASVISSIGAAPERFAYATSKAAVIGLTKAIALDYADKNIRCNAICPSAVETPSMLERIAAMDDPVQARAAFEDRQPIGRMATTAEIAEMAVYLAGDLSDCVTGSTIIMDGGAKL